MEPDLVQRRLRWCKTSFHQYLSQRLNLERVQTEKSTTLVTILGLLLHDCLIAKWSVWSAATLFHSSNRWASWAHKHPDNMIESWEWKFTACCTKEVWRKDRRKKTSILFETGGEVLVAEDRWSQKKKLTLLLLPEFYEKSFFSSWLLYQLKSLCQSDFYLAPQQRIRQRSYEQNCSR